MDVRCRRWVWAALLLTMSACATPEISRVPRIAVLAAFPAELAALLEHATVEETRIIEGHRIRLGRLGGAPVALAMTRIGLANASATTSLVLDHVDVRGVIVSGVAGTTRRIGDVDVPVAWALESGQSFSADPEWLEIARSLAAKAAVSLERCTDVDVDGARRRVCLPHEPSLAVSGTGLSTDPFDGQALPCDPGGDEVSGCDVTEGRSGNRPWIDLRSIQPLETHWETTVDMETAAIGREAAARGLPYIAFRAGSDGAGDPLGLPGFPAQFYAYYRLAARNAAAATLAFLERLPAH
jgi:nucleoside phosphorylase